MGLPSSSTDRPGVIHARPVRHPGRWVAIAGIGVLIAMLISSFVTNERWNFPMSFEIMVQSPVLEGLVKGTLLGTLGAMVIGVGLGVPLAVMRLSENPVLRGVAFAFTWFFRAIPRYVLLVIMGTGLGYLYSTLEFGIPFGQQLSQMLGWGMSSGQTMRRVVLPQAMRVIVPPTGNETIAMVKDTSLLTAIPVITELFYQTRAIGTRTLQIMPSLVAATIWYLVVCSVLMVGQFYLERYFGRGFGAVPKKTKEMLVKIEADH